MDGIWQSQRCNFSFIEQFGSAILFARFSCTFIVASVVLGDIILVVTILIIVNDIITAFSLQIEAAI
jgi:hypothetical protein